MTPEQRRQIIMALSGLRQDPCLVVSALTPDALMLKLENYRAIALSLNVRLRIVALHPTAAKLSLENTR